MPQRGPFQSAIRLLFILVKGSTPLPQPDPGGASSVFKGEARLHAFDFWIRYPDYLADELLDLFEANRDQQVLAAARAIFADEEPDLRRYPMIRYRFGAYERIDNALAVLRSRDLVRLERVTSATQVRETDFLVMPKAHSLAEEIAADFPALEWYARRAKMVADLAQDRGGTALKEHQYKKAEYAETQLRGIIPSIANRVKERMESLSYAGLGSRGAA